MSSLRAIALICFAFFVLPGVALAQDPSTGGTVYTPPPPPAPENLTVPGTTAKLMPDGTAAAPADAPVEVQQAIWAANTIQDLPYRYGGGHAKVEDTAYDCSGTVSYALIHAGLLKSPLDSSSFFRFGKRGRGQWITDLHQLRPCLRGDRGAPAGHQLVCHPRRQQAQVLQGTRARTPLAPDKAPGQGVP